MSATAREQDPLEQDYPQARPREWDAGIVGPAWISFLPRYAPEVAGHEPNPNGTRDLAVVLLNGVKHEGTGGER